MELGIVIAAVLLAVVAWMFLSKDDSKESDVVIPEPTPEPVDPVMEKPVYTEADLAKKTKKELLELAAEMGLKLKASDTKPNLIIQIIAGKEGAHLL